MFAPYAPLICQRYILIYNNSFKVKVGDRTRAICFPFSRLVLQGVTPRSGVIADYRCASRLCNRHRYLLICQINIFVIPGKSTDLLRTLTETI